MSTNSIRTRLTISFTFIVALLMLIATFGLTRFQTQIAKDRARDLLDSGMARIQQELSTNTDKIDIAALEEQSKDIRTDHLELQVVSPEGKSLYPSSLFGDIRNDIGIYQTKSIPYGKNTLVIGYWYKPHTAAMAGTFLYMLLLSAFVTVCASIGAWHLVGRTLAPIEKLAKQTEAISGLHAANELAAPSQDAEIVSLVGTLNGLLTRIRRETASKGRFYAAASHELRTPLQALTGHLELALTRERTKEEYREVVIEANGQAQRLARLVKELLFLNQLENPHRLQLESVDMTEVVERNLSYFENEIALRKLSLKIDLPGEWSLIAPRVHVETLVRNLIENAVKYADFGKEISISQSPLSAVEKAFQGDTESHTPRLIVHNSFSEDATWVSDQLFEPFQRLEESRNSATGGNGLGLAICKAIADSNGWKISLQPSGDGVSATLDFCTNENENEKGS